jgi:hypothetical protein
MSAASATQATVAQVEDMGFRRDWAEVALKATSNDAEAAINFIMSNLDSMDSFVEAEAFRIPDAPLSTSTEKKAAILDLPLPPSKYQLPAPFNTTWMCECCQATNLSSVSRCETCTFLPASLPIKLPPSGDQLEFGFNELVSSSKATCLWNCAACSFENKCVDEI